MRAIVTLAIKDVRLLLHDKMGFFFVFVFPLLVAIFFGMIFSGGGGETSAIDVAVVVEDAGEEAAAFVNELMEGPEVDVTRLNDRAEAADLVRRGRQTAFIVVEDGFSEASRRMFWGEPMRLSIGVDPARRAEAAMLEGILTAAAFERMQGAMADRDTMRESTRAAMESLRAAEEPIAGGDALEQFLNDLNAFLDAEGDDAADTAGGGLFGGGDWNPVEIQRIDLARERTGEPQSSYVISFPQGIIWGIMGCAAGFGISLVTERTRGTLVRLRLAPIARWKVLVGKGLACFITTVAVAAILLAIGWLVFGVRPHSVPLLVAAVGSSAFAFVGIMMLLSVTGRTEASAGGIGWAILLVAGMFGGAMVPLFIMPEWIQQVSHFSPVKWAMLSMEGALWRGFSPAEMFLPCAILIGIGLGGFAIGGAVFDWSERA